MRLLTLLLVACGYISDPREDPGEPTHFSLHNVSTDTLYLRVNDAHMPVMRVDGVATSFACADRLCSDSCDVQTCAAVPAVRALLPDEALLVEWNHMTFIDGSSECGACLRAQRIAKGHYPVSFCFSRSLSGPKQRLLAEPAILVGPSLVDETCAELKNVLLPSPDVLWGIDLQ